MNDTDFVKTDHDTYAVHMQPKHTLLKSAVNLLKLRYVTIYTRQQAQQTQHKL